MLTRQDLMQYIENHGHTVDTAHVDDANIRALEVSTCDGERFEEWVTIPATFRAVRIWLGY